LEDIYKILTFADTEILPKTREVLRWFHIGIH